jgi:hypothetical protein
MMSVRPFLLATLPSYLLIASMILSAIGVYQLSQVAFNNPFPSATPGIAGFVFFAIFTLSFLIELAVYSKLMDQLQLSEIRVPLPRHWKSVILDIISWFEAHESWEAGFVVGGIVTIGALGEAVIYAMQAIHASLLAFLAVGFVGLFVIFFGLGVGQVLIRSTISPVGVLSDKELDEIVSALPKLTQENIEYLKRNRTFVPSAKAKRVAMILFMVALGALGASFAAIYWNFASFGMPLAYLGDAAAMIGVVLIGFPVSGSKISSLSRVLNRNTDDSEPV